MNADGIGDGGFPQQLQRLDALLGAVDRLTDPAARAVLREALQAILDLHGAGLARILEHLGAAGTPAFQDCLRDEVVGGLLILHGLHPIDLETRVREALEEVRPVLRSHGGNVALVGVSEGVVRLRLEGSCHGCPSSTITMRQTIEQAILARAPDAIALELDGAEDHGARTQDRRGLVVLSGI